MAVPLVIESSIWGAVALIVFLSRIVNRFLQYSRVSTRIDTTKHSIRRGICRLPAEDYAMTIAMVFYVAELVSMNITAKLQSNLLPPGYLTYHTIDPQERADREFGSKWTVAVEQCQISTIWLVKLCVLSMWYNLTNMAFTTRHRIVLFIAIYVILTWLLMESFYFFLWCRPFSNYWAVPTPDPRQCAAALNHLITNAVCNLTSDLLLLAVSVSIAWERKLKGSRRWAFIFLCSLGCFIIACAVANKAYSFENPYGSQWTFWYIRECSTAIILSNLVYCWPRIEQAATVARSRISSIVGIKRPSSFASTISPPGPLPLNHGRWYCARSSCSDERVKSLPISVASLEEPAVDTVGPLDTGIQSKTAAHLDLELFRY